MLSLNSQNDRLNKLTAAAYPYKCGISILVNYIIGKQVSHFQCHFNIPVCISLAVFISSLGFVAPIRAIITVL